MPAQSIIRFAVVVPAAAFAALVACGNSMATGADAKKAIDSSAASVGTTFAGNASNLTFQHYDFPQGGTPTPDPDGCTSSVPAMTFSAAITTASGRSTSSGPAWLPPFREPVRLVPPGEPALRPLATPCALSSTYQPAFGSGSQEASNNGSGSNYTEDLEWQGVLAGTGSATQFMALQAFAGGGISNTPD